MSIVREPDGSWRVSYKGKTLARFATEEAAIAFWSQYPQQPPLATTGEDDVGKGGRA